MGKQLTKNALRNLVISEAKKFGKPKSVEDVKAKEVDADKLASSLEKKEDFTVAETREIAKIAAKSLVETERRLVSQLKEVRARRARLARVIGKK